MDAVFTLPYPEYIVAETLAKLLPKREGFSVNIPLSRQQKGMDLLVYHRATGKAAAIQVKSSRPYRGAPPKRKNTPKRFNYYLWFKRFEYQKEAADFYIIFGLYPEANIIEGGLNRARVPQNWWKHKILLLTDTEMENLLKGIRSQNDSFFAFGFDTYTDEIFLTRGVEIPQLYSDFLIERKVKVLREFLV